MMPSRGRATLIISGLAGAATAAVLLVVTLQSGESEPFKGNREGGPTTPAGLVFPTGPLQFYLATIMPGDGGASQPTEIDIEGERFPYDPALVFQRIQDTPEGWQWQISYLDPNSIPDPFSIVIPVSTLILDWTGKVTKQDILPWHAGVFQPLLDYADVALEVRTDVPWPTPTPTPTTPGPTKVVIQGVEIMLPPGATLATAVPDAPGITIINMGRSYISFDKNGVIATHVAAGDESTFGPVVEAIEALPWASPAGQ